MNIGTSSTEALYLWEFYDINLENDSINLIKASTEESPTNIVFKNKGTKIAKMIIFKNGCMSTFSKGFLVSDTIQRIPDGLEIRLLIIVVQKKVLRKAASPKI